MATGGEVYTDNKLCIRYELQHAGNMYCNANKLAII